MMKSIFTRPVFINPQAYLVIPELALIHRSTPYDFSSNKYVFQVITTGQIEGKLLQAGNEYILHLDLYSKDGNVVLGEFYLDGSYIESADNFVLEQSNGFVTITFGDKGDENISYPGLIAAWSAKGKSNDDEDRAILKDLTGNGYDITLNGFAFSEMSGYGGYPLGIGRKHYDECKFYQTIKSKIPNIKTLRINISGIDELKLQSASRGKIEITDGGSKVFYTIITDGYYEYDIPLEYETFMIRFGGGANETIPCNVTVEETPEYPDALVFDGVDDYGINENMPILTDYTVIVNRRYIETERNSCLISKAAGVDEGAFIMELIQGDSNETLNLSFGNSGRSKLYTSTGISWLNTTSYNGIRVAKGGSIDTNKIFIGTIRKGDARSFKGAFYSAYLFDRSLDEQEIKSFIRKYIDPEYLLPSEIPTPDCYYDFTNGDNTASDVATIKDLSGNENDAVAHNFAWNEEGSGYKDGALVFDGVDDYVSLGAFDSGFKTVFIKCLWSQDSKIIYDQRNNSDDFENAINTAGTYAYNGRNRNGKTYINGVLNTSITSGELKRKTHLITSELILGEKTSIPYIGCANNKSFNVDIKLYKFLGFKEALTEEQINAIIKKYNLLDGVDEIEVS